MKLRSTLAARGVPGAEVCIESWTFDHVQPEDLALNPDALVPTLVVGDKLVTDRFNSAMKLCGSEIHAEAAHRFAARMCGPKTPIHDVPNVIR